nr:MAG TPA: hypothetical protein [Caudoviricetes sp.]
MVVFFCSKALCWQYKHILMDYNIFITQRERAKMNEVTIFNNCTARKFKQSEQQR